MSKKKGGGGKKTANDDDWDAILSEEIAKNAQAQPAQPVVEQAPLKQPAQEPAAKDEDSESDEEGEGAAGAAKKVIDKFPVSNPADTC